MNVHEKPQASILLEVGPSPFWELLKELNLLLLNSHYSCDPGLLNSHYSCDTGLLNRHYSRVGQGEHLDVREGVRGGGEAVAQHGHHHTHHHATVGEAEEDERGEGEYTGNVVIQEMFAENYNNNNYY